MSCIDGCGGWEAPKAPTKEGGAEGTDQGRASERASEWAEEGGGLYTPYLLNKPTEQTAPMHELKIKKFAVSSAALRHCNWN